MTEKKNMITQTKLNQEKKKKIVFCIAYPNAESFDMQKQLKSENLFFFCSVAVIQHTIFFFL